MYEMRAESVLGLEPVWHVVAKDASTTLCGRRAPSSNALKSNSAAEHYCPPCMAAVQATMRRPASPARQ
jgi:hypothetical protein